ncbi:MAG: prolipoprotein diacylglyceryl transferase [Deltaproteobacteria bacterium]|jgi:phosphatidylglycerol:prolipoprotein diacylglycerol transferase|nr:prolipoprotein diacylglyceryl transferase [Deltaproteobacteria bacterium]MBW2520142.1 prolipoprotein diacylglyceryl transferase [Deltaproteobacteria bacterium]
MIYPKIDPVILQIGPVAIRWYGLMYLIGFGAAYLLIRHLARLRGLPIDKDTVSDLLFQGVLGVVVGGRLGYVLFYKPAWYFSHPLEILMVWQGGMSFHGGLVGVVVATVLFCRRKQIPILLTGDILVTSATVGLGCGRVGNFINGELWGKVTDLPWGMVFPGGGNLPRHPSQLYEAILEGPVLLAILYWLHKKDSKPGLPFFSFFIGYGTFRFLVEFLRQPDPHLGYLWGGATMGQLLSLPMIGFGCLGLFFLHKSQR